METEKPEEKNHDIDPFLFFAVMMSVLAVKSEYNDEPEE